MEFNSSGEYKCRREALENIGQEPVPSYLELTGGESPHCGERDSLSESEWYSIVELKWRVAIPRTTRAFREAEVSVRSRIWSVGLVFLFLRIKMG